MIRPIQRFLMTISSLGSTPDDDEASRLQKSILVLTTTTITIAAIAWGFLYLFSDELTAALIPLSYSVISILGLIDLTRTHRFDRFRVVQTLLILLLPFFLMLVLGGFVSGSAVILWAFLAPLAALLSWNTRQAVLWFFIFLASLAVAGFLTPLLRPENNLPNALIIAFYVFNLGAVSSIAFGLLRYFVRQKDLAAELLHKNRELERTNLEQELLLRQNDKLATLGRLSAGVAHELNNPAAAAQRGVAQLRETISQLARAEFQLGRSSFSEEHLETLTELSDLAQQRGEQSIALDPLARSDREAEIESALDEAGIDNAWDLSPTLVSMGFEPETVKNLAETLPAAQFSTAIDTLNGTYAANTLLDEIGEGTGRISQIVAALKSYTYMDQAPVQVLDIHEGLEHTLMMLRGKLEDGVEVRREYAQDLPQVEAYGGELNQVWTNLIDNAVEAMNGQGELTLRTRSEGAWVVVEIIDSGPGVPKEVAPNVFDPFFTTKPIGQGTGLGLNISYNIIVQKHQGEISVQSQPGETIFEVKLPLERQAA